MGLRKIRLKVFRQTALLFILPYLAACGGGERGEDSASLPLNIGSSTSSTTISLPAGFPQFVTPPDNPVTDEKAELGRFLFYDKNLSGNESQSCASCHRQERAFTDGIALAFGSTGEQHPRNSLSLTNVAYNATLNWANPATVTIEQQIPIPIFGEFPIELGVSGKEEEVLERFRNDTNYQRMFRQAFPNDDDPVSYGNIVKSLATFTRVLISGNSPFDKFVYQGDESALSESALRGMDLFFSERLECFHCHNGFNFTLSTTHESSAFTERPFHNTGLFNIGGTGAFPVNNQGIFEFTQQAEDMGKFRAPTLRNLAYTAPYMHDGSIATLDEVIDFYSMGGRNISEGPLAGDGRRNPFKSNFISGFSITQQEREDLKNFLESLSDPTFVTDPRFSDPFQ
jgi:cytochrome c peroxidase